jgi:hypothetical protein
LRQVDSGRGLRVLAVVGRTLFGLGDYPKKADGGAPLRAEEGQKVLLRLWLGRNEARRIAINIANRPGEAPVQRAA